MRIGFISDTHGDPTAWEKATAVLGDLDAGSCAFPRQEGEAPNVGLYEDGKLMLLDIETGEKYSEGLLPG